MYKYTFHGGGGGPIPPAPFRRPYIYIYVQQHKSLAHTCECFVKH